MLGKLLSCDFKAFGRVMLPLQGGVLLAGIAGCFMVNFSYKSISNSLSSSYYSSSSQAVLPLEEMLNATMTMLSGLFFAVVFASFWVTLFLVARHFYKSFLKDEGYLAFTLPVTTNQHVLSKVIAGFIWVLINALILCFTIVLLTLVGFTDSGIFNREVLGYYGDLFRELSNAPGVVLIIQAILLGILFVLCNVLQIYASLVVGATIARTHKVLAAIGIYIAFSFVMNTIMTFTSIGSSIVFEMSNYVMNSDYSWFYALQPVILPMLLFYVVVVVVFFILSKYLLKNRLNLD